MPVRAGGCFREIFRLIRVIARIPTRTKGEPLRDFAVRGYDGTAFLEALALFATLPALKDLVLRLREHDGPYESDRVGAQNNDCPPDIVLQFLIFRALGEVTHGFPAHLRSLTIDNFLPLPHPYLQSGAMIQHISTLTHFAINTTSHCAAFPPYDPRSEQSSNNLRVFSKSALSSSLVSLQLHNACIRPVEVLFPVSEVHLPRLAYLSLQRTYFSRERDVEDFIARHGGTLVELKLFLCPMAISITSRRGTADEDFYRWAKVWDRLNRDLRVLKNLVVSERHDSDGVEDVGLGRYIDNCYHCEAVVVKARITRADDKVFERLQKSAESRS